MKTKETKFVKLIVCILTILMLSSAALITLIGKGELVNLNRISQIFGIDNEKLLADNLFEGDPGKVISQVFAANQEKTITIVPADSAEATADIVIDIHYDLELLDSNAIYPPGTLEIRVPAPNLDTSSTVFQYDTSAEDQIFSYQAGTVAKDGYITLTNAITLNSTVSGNIKVRFRVPVRNCTPDEDGYITYTGMKSKLISTAPGYETIHEATDLEFTITTRPDTITLIKTAHAISKQPNGLVGTSYSGDPNDYYWVEYRVRVIQAEYTRAITEIEISDIIAGMGITNSGTLVEMIREPGGRKTLWYTGQTKPEGYIDLDSTGFYYASNRSIEIALIVMYEKSGFVGSTVNNTVELKFKLNGASDFAEPKIASASLPISNCIITDFGTMESRYNLGNIISTSNGTAGANITNPAESIYNYIYWGKHYEGDEGNIEICLDLLQAVGNFPGGETHYKLLPEDFSYSEILLRPMPGCSKISVWGIGTESGTAWTKIQDDIDGTISNTISIPASLGYRVKVVYHNPTLYINYNDYNSSTLAQIRGTIKLTPTGSTKLSTALISQLQVFNSMDCVNSGVGTIAGDAGTYTADTDAQMAELDNLHTTIYGKYKLWRKAVINCVWDNINYTIGLYTDAGFGERMKYKYNGTTKYYENDIEYRINRGSGSVTMVSGDVVVLLPEGIEFIPGGATGLIYGPITTIENFNGTGRQLIIMEEVNSRCNIKTRIKDINAFNGINTVYHEVYLVITNPNSDGISSEGMVPDNGSQTNAFIDLNQNGKENEYVYRGSRTVEIIRTLDSNAQAIKTQVKTSNMTGYGLGGEEIINGIFEYKLSITTLNNVYKNVVIYDVLPHVGDKHHNGTERGSETNLIFVDVDTTEAESMGYNPIIYYSTSTNPGDLESGNWTTIKPTNAADIKALAFDFGEDEFEANSMVAVYIKVRSEMDLEVENKEVHNSFYYEKMHKDTITDTWIPDPMLETSPTNVTFNGDMYAVEIIKELAPSQNAEVEAGDIVNYTITVTNIGSMDLHNLNITDSLNNTWLQTITELKAGESETFNFAYTVPNTATDGQVIKNIATVVSDEMPEPISDDEDITIGIASYTIEKELVTGQRNPVIPGEEVNYTIIVTNTGSITLHNVEIIDSLDGTWIKEIATLPHTINNVISYEFKYTVPTNTPNNTTIKNIVTAVCDEITEPETDEKDVLVYIPELTITKELAPGQRNPVIPGETVIYTITVENTGDIELNNILVTDSLNNTWIQTIIKLEPGESEEYTFEYIVPINTPNGTTVKNIVTAICDEISEPEIDEEDVEVYTPDLTITKELAPGQRNPVIPGETVTYKIVVTNTGDIELNNVVVTDSLDNTWIQTIIKLEPGESEEYTFEYIVPINTPNGTTVKNIVTAVCDEITEPETDEEDVLVYTPDLTITKELAAGQKNLVMPGEKVTYVITVTNTGNIELNNIEVTDSLDDTWTQTITKLEPGENEEYIFEYIIPINTPNNTIVKNVVTAICDELPDPLTDEVDVTVKIPGLNVTKELSPGQRNPVLPGEIVTYTITVINTGNIELTNVVVTDSLDLSWTQTITKLDPGESEEYTFEYTVPINTPNGTTITNVVTAVCDELPIPDTDEEDIEVRTPELAIEKTLAQDQRNPVLPGETVIYTIIVTNTGEIELNNIEVIDSLNGTWVETITKLNPGESKEYTFEYTIPNNTPNGTTITNVVTAICDELEDPLTDEEDIEVRTPELAIEKTLAQDQRNPVLPGETVIYVITVTNTGEIELNNIEVTDSLDDTWIETITKLDPGESKEYTFEYTVPNNTPNGTTIINVVTVVCDEIEDPETDEEDILVYVPELTIEKELVTGQRNPVLPGETVTYVITVTNTGEIELTNIEITDSLDLGWVETITKLEPGESKEYTFEYIVPNDTPNNTIITNVVTAICDELEDPEEDEEDILVYVPELTIRKELAQDQRNPVLPGETVTYTITVTNTGDIELNNIEVIDSLDDTWVETITKLEPGESKEYTFEYVVPVDTLNGTIITNVVTAVCDELEEPITDEEDIEVRTPEISITKELIVGQKNSVMPGEEIIYKIVVENTGNIDLHNVMVKDSLDDTWIQTIPVLPTGEKEEYEFTYIVPMEITNGTIINVATAVSDETPEPKKDEEEVIIKEPGYTIIKTLASGQNKLVMPGEEVKYVITILNTGEVDLTNVKVTDSLDGEWEQIIPVLEIGESKEYEFIYQIPIDTDYDEVIINVAKVECDELEEITAEEEVIVKEPVLIVRKELAEDQDRIVYPGEIVRYKIVVENVGERDLHNIEITDILDDGWIQTISVLQTGEKIEYEFEYEVPLLTEKGEIITNIVIVKSDELDEITDEEEVIANVKIPDVKITKELASDQKIPILPGEEITYVITVENTGEVDLTNVIVTDSLDENWIQELEKLEIGQKVEYEFVYKVPQNTKNNEEIVNIASIISDELDEKEDEVTIEVKVPDIKITKELAEGQSEIVYPGEKVTYRIMVENTGEVNLTNVVITDSLDEEGMWTRRIETLKHSEFNIAYYTFEYTVPESATEGEIITNIAMVTCDELEEKEDEVEIIISENPVLELTIEKELARGQSGTVVPGSEVKYEITVTNTGTENLNHVIVTDSMDKNWIQEIEVLEKSESKTYEFIYKVPENTKEGEAIINIATAKSDELEEQKDDVEIEVKTNNQNNNNNNTTPPPSGNNTPNTSQSNNNNTVVYNNTIVYNNRVYTDKSNQDIENYSNNYKSDNPYTGDINIIRIIIISISAITIIIISINKLRTKKIHK